MLDGCFVECFLGEPSTDTSSIPVYTGMQRGDPSAYRQIRIAHLSGIVLK